MTAEEKKKLAFLLDITGDHLRDGYKRPRGEYRFSDDPAPPLSGEQDEPFLSGFPEEADSIETVAGQIRHCTACPLHARRKQAVPGEGVSRPLALVVGEGPGAEEDFSGRPFVGEAGKLLDKMLAAIGLYRDKNCFIANVVKCRPPNNREPLPEEAAACAPFLARQIAILKPRLILAAGRTAAQNLLATGESLGSLRGRFSEYPGTGGSPIPGQSSIPLLPTYHPSALLRDDAKKRPAWEDLKMLRTKLAELDAAYAKEAGLPEAGLPEAGLPEARHPEAGRL
ncbi:MAG: uracil-DNA glycosylase [Spirochaetaceae bacterium]|jgi:DNA polymerase|nr:uracil-DNA glycosylase [Spirochaetaceae bacterium]